MSSFAADIDDWRARAACATLAPDVFFPISDKGRSLADTARARAVCARCEVSDDCLAYALRTRERHGIWGGLTEEERRVLWSRHRADGTGRQARAPHQPGRTRQARPAGPQAA